MEAYLWPLDSFHLITTIIRQRNNHIREEKRKIQSKECLGFVQLFMCVCKGGLYLYIISYGCISDCLYVCVYDDTYAARRIWGRLLDIWVAMCNESCEQTRIWPSNFVLFFSYVRVCSDYFSWETNYHLHCITKKINLWFISIIDKDVWWIKTSEWVKWKYHGDKTCCIVIYYEVLCNISILCWSVFCVILK